MQIAIALGTLIFVFLTVAPFIQWEVREVIGQNAPGSTLPEFKLPFADAGKALEETITKGAKTIQNVTDDAEKISGGSGLMFALLAVGLVVAVGSRR